MTFFTIWSNVYNLHYHVLFILLANNCCWIIPMFVPFQFYLHLLINTYPMMCCDKCVVTWNKSLS